MESDLFKIKSRIWNGWSNNYVRREEGYRIHMFEEGVTRPGRSLCGVRLQDSGLLNLNEVEPGCYKCRHILIKRGLLPATQATRSASGD